MDLENLQMRAPRPFFPISGSDSPQKYAARRVRRCLYPRYPRPVELVSRLGRDRQYLLNRPSDASVTAPLLRCP